MFDFRYHALSLSAVIVALVLGVLLGVAIGDRGLVSSGETSLRNNLRADVVAAKHHADDLQGQLSDRTGILSKVAGLAVDGRLSNEEFGMVFLGSKSNSDKTLAGGAIKSGGGNLRWVLAVHEPLDAAGIAALAPGTQYANLATDPPDPNLYEALGRRVGFQLISGGKLVKHESKTLFDSFDGDLVPVPAIVLVHNDPPEGLDKAHAAALAAFEHGVVEGMTKLANATVVGVQTQNTKPSQSGWFTNQTLNYVSDLDQVEGQVSLVYALTGSGGPFGHGTNELALPTPNNG
jgi:hypothetical protein